MSVNGACNSSSLSSATEGPSVRLGTATLHQPLLPAGNKELLTRIVPMVAPSALDPPLPKPVSASLRRIYIITISRRGSGETATTVARQPYCGR